MRYTHAWRWMAVLLVAGIVAGCEGPAGEAGDRGLPGADGQRGEKGVPGEIGEPGEEGEPGTDGRNGIDGEPGPVAEAPRIADLFPAAGADQTKVTIHGDHFSTATAGNLVYFDGMLAQVLEASRNRLVVRPQGLKADAPRTVQVSVIANKQTSNAIGWSLMPAGTVIAGEHRALADITDLVRTVDGTLYIADRVGGVFSLDTASGDLKPVPLRGIDTHSIVGLAAPADGSLYVSRLEEVIVPGGDHLSVVHIERVDFLRQRADRIVSVQGDQWARFEVRSDGAILLLGPTAISVISPTSTVIDDVLAAPEGIVLEDFVLIDDEVFAIGNGRLLREPESIGPIEPVDVEGIPGDGLVEFVAPADGEAAWHAIGALDGRLTVASTHGIFDVSTATGARTPAAPPMTWVYQTWLQPLPDGSIVWRSSDLVGIASANEGVRLLAATAVGVDFVPEGNTVTWASPHDAYIGALFRTDAESTRLVGQLPHGMRAIEEAGNGYVMTAPLFTSVTHFDRSAGGGRQLYRSAAVDVAVLGTDLFLLYPTTEGTAISRGTLAGDPPTPAWGTSASGVTTVHADDSGVWTGGEHGLSLIPDLVAGGEAQAIRGFAWVSAMTLDTDGALLVVQGGQVWRWTGADRPTLVNDGLATGSLPWEPEFARAFPAEGGDYVASSYRGFVRVVR